MRILKISDVFFPRVNGVSTSIATFSRELEALGHEVSLVAPAYGEDAPSERLYRVPSWRVPFDPEDRLMNFGAANWVRRQLGDQRFDIVHVHTPFIAHRLGLSLAREWGIPVVETYHTFFEEYLHHYLPFAPRRLTSGVARRFSRSQCNRVDAIVVPSRAMSEALEDYGVDTRMERIPTGLRPEEFRTGNGAAFRQRHHIHGERPTLLFVGRLAHEKNIGFLLSMLRQVAQRIPDVLLVLAGEGPAHQALQRQIYEFGLQEQVLILGYMDRQGELLDCYRAADTFVFASRTETQGLVLLEAMALAVPVVSTAVMGTRDILQPGQGCLVAEEDEEHFASQVIRLLEDRTLRLELRRQAQAYALGQWSAAAMAERLAGLYGRLLEGDHLRAAA